MYYLTKLELDLHQHMLYIYNHKQNFAEEV